METIHITYESDFAILRLQRGKGNAINHQMVKEIRDAVATLSNTPEVRGLIITGQPQFFSVGLDLIELAKYGFHEIKAFWTDFFGMMLDLAKFEKPTIAAITGHSPAGGAVIAITCDYRFMALGDKFTIGLNEVAVGILISEPIFHLYAFWLGQKNAYQALLEGRLFKVDEALKIGLIDEAHPLETIVDAARQKMTSILRADNFILRETKKILRKSLWQDISQDQSAELDERAKYWMSPESQASIQKMVQMLISRKS